jgi:hypothetical protein
MSRWSRWIAYPLMGMTVLGCLFVAASIILPIAGSDEIPWHEWVLAYFLVGVSIDLTALKLTYRPQRSGVICCDCRGGRLGSFTGLREG